MRMLKSPRLKRLNGREMMESIGFMTLKPIARRMPPITKVFSPSWRISPSKRRLVKYRANP